MFVFSCVPVFVCNSVSVFFVIFDDVIIVRSKTEVSTSAVGVWEKGGVGVGVWESFRSITQQNISCNVIMFLVSVLVMVFMYLWLGVFVVLCLYILCCGVSV